MNTEDLGLEDKSLTECDIFFLLKEQAISPIEQPEALRLLEERSPDGTLSQKSIETLYRAYIYLMYHIVNEYLNITGDDNLKFELLGTASEELLYCVQEYDPEKHSGGLNHFVNYRLNRALVLKIEDEYCQGITEDDSISTYKLERVMKAEYILTRTGVVPTSEKILEYLRHKYPNMNLDISEIHYLRLLPITSRGLEKVLWHVDLDHGFLVEELVPAMRTVCGEKIDDFLSGNMPYEKSRVLFRRLAKAKSFKPLGDYLAPDRYKW